MPLEPWKAGQIRSLNESPSEKEGKSMVTTIVEIAAQSLNESPSEKEGKYPVNGSLCPETEASMKALPKRKGNYLQFVQAVYVVDASMKALPKRKGNAVKGFPFRGRFISLNESPSEKEGKFRRRVSAATPPPRCLNESPSEKEGKSHSQVARDGVDINASMKALPKRKGNATL